MLLIVYQFVLQGFVFMIVSLIFLLWCGLFTQNQLRVLFHKLCDKAIKKLRNALVRHRRYTHVRLDLVVGVPDSDSVFVLAPQDTLGYLLVKLICDNDFVREFFLLDVVFVFRLFVVDDRLNHFAKLLERPDVCDIVDKDVSMDLSLILRSATLAPFFVLKRIRNYLFQVEL